MTTNVTKFLESCNQKLIGADLTGNNSKKVKSAFFGGNRNEIDADLILDKNFCKNNSRFCEYIPP